MVIVRTKIISKKESADEVESGLFIFACEINDTQISVINQSIFVIEGLKNI